MNEQLLINLIGIRSRASPSQAAGTPGPPLDTRARMPRFARAFSMVRTVMRRATPPAALGLIATNRHCPFGLCALFRSMSLIFLTTPFR